ncbi:hypothetical protein GAY29_14290 [Azospirillum brasilense]|uniref:hypothetical protein n=1 Tax=Azospirillum brasilense TaxID=192 RepID=UPI00190A9708|nr:hypothetical protein [Azospirillum brasilense]MBK3734257.1 hypothetical protein [Azospirillum brasilense]
MCNYELLAIDEGVEREDILKQVDRAVDTLGPMSRFHYVFITSQGSFFDRHEVDYQTRMEIAARLRRAGVKAVSTESEAKYCIDVRPLLEFREQLGAPLSIGIGLEAADEFIRNVVVNKGLPLETFQKATAHLCQHHVGFYCYVSLGKPFLSVEEDISDAITAVNMCFDNGGFMAVLEMINIQPHTLTAHLYHRDRYVPPSLWTGIATLLRLPDNIRSRVSLKGTEADVEPVPLALPSGCPRCDTLLRNAIRQWNYERNVSVLRDVWGRCKCFEQWEKDQRASAVISISERVDYEWGRIEAELRLQNPF